MGTFLDVPFHIAMTGADGALRLTKEQAVKEINNLSGKRFDPAIVKVFCDII